MSLGIAYPLLLGLERSVWGRISVRLAMARREQEHGLENLSQNLALNGQNLALKGQILANYSRQIPGVHGRCNRVDLDASLSLRPLSISLPNAWRLQGAASRGPGASVDPGGAHRR